MTHRSLSMCTTAIVALTFATSVMHADQIRRRGGESTQSQVPLEVSLKVGSGAYNAKGQGSCTHAPMASIYGVLSQMWSVRQQANGRSVSLTLWKPSDGSASMFSLSVDETTISTVRGGQVMGGGTVTLAPAAKGGTFTVNAKAKTGEAITGTIKCDAFTPAIAEGGD